MRLFRDDPPVFLLKSKGLQRIPARRKPGDASLFLRREVVEPGRSFLAVESKREANNVNSVDLTVDSRWFENRIGTGVEKKFYESRGDPKRASSRRVSKRPKSALHGPSVLGEWRVFAAGEGEGGPWVAFRDERKRAFLLQFDHPEWPGLGSASTLAANLLLHEAGYMVPERHMVFFTSDTFVLAENAVFCKVSEPLDAIWPYPGVSRRSGKTLTLKKLDSILHPLHREEDGSIRALATLLPDPATHVYLGPFPLSGRRPDDSNDYFEHQNMRELRGLRLMAAWLGLYGIEERSGADFFDRKTRMVVHFIWDLRGALGADIDGRPKEPGAAFGVKNLDKESKASASRERENDIKKYPGVGYLPVEGFSPQEWNPAKRHPAFVRATGRDFFWAGRILASFTSQDIKRVVDAAYLPERTARMLWARLWLRTRQAACFGLSQSAPLTMFSVQTAGGEGLQKGGEDRKKDERGRFQLCAVDLRRKGNFDKDAKSETKYVATLRNAEGKILSRRRVEAGKRNVSGRFCIMIFPDEAKFLPEYVIVEVGLDVERAKTAAVHLRRSDVSGDREALFRVVGIVP